MTTAAASTTGPGHSSVAVSRKMSISAGAVEFLKQYVFASIKKDKKGYAIGFSAVFLVTFFLGFFQATISNVRFVFLKTAENEISEVDFLLLPASVTVTIHHIS